ncbi:carboxylate--amine ligase [Thalassotalea montiporae]
MSTQESKNKIIVYGVDTQIGLALIRELGERGCCVIAIGKSAHSIGLKSRYVSEGYVLKGDNDKAKVNFLNSVHNDTKATHLICVSEDDILFFNRVRAEIAPIVPLVPDLQSINKVLSKEYTANQALQVGIDIPKSWQLKSAAQLKDVLPQLRFPLILKWSNPHSVMSAARKAGLKIEKLIYCYDQQELEKWVVYYAPLNDWPMIQEYCKGRGLGQFFYMHEGEALLRFQHMRIHEWPPEGGYSTLCQSISLDKHTELQKKSIELLKRINWRGVAMVEYRFDPDTQRAVLMEINGRFWGSFPLAYHSRIPFAWYTYQIQGLNKVPTAAHTNEGNLLCRNTLVDFKRLSRIIFAQNKIKDKSLRFNIFSELMSFVFGFFNPSMRYFVFSFNDPKPFAQDMKNLLCKLVGRR